MVIDYSALLINEPLDDLGATFVFAHGAGAPMDSNFMNAIAERLALKGIEVIRFEFPYMAERRSLAKRRPPSPVAQLAVFYRDLLVQLAPHLQGRKVFIGGKSMGGRIASMIANQCQCEGVIALGYPFHPVGKPETLRIEHLSALTKPLLIVQGTRDKLGSLDEVVTYPLPSQVQILWLEDGDHDLSPRVKSGFTFEHHLQVTINRLHNFIYSSTTRTL